MNKTFSERINAQWDKNAPLKMDWMGLENLLTDILATANLQNDSKVSLCKEAIEAYTRRGNFNGQY